MGEAINTRTIFSHARPSMKNRIDRFPFTTLILAAVALFSQQVGAESNRVTFPENLDKLVHYTTVKRGNVTEYMLTCHTN